MKLTRNYDLKHHLAMAVFIGIAAIGGCDKHTSSGETVGQRMDKIIDKTNATAEQAGSRIEAVARSAEVAVKSTAETVQQKAGQVGAVIDDSAITASIKAGLLQDPGLSALRIDVNTVKGEVTLKGDVTSDAARERAEHIALAVAGVMKVNNSINVNQMVKKVSWTVV